MPTIGIDCRFAGLDVGLGRYTRELITQLVMRNDPWSYILFVRSADELWLQGLPSSITIIPLDVSHYSLHEQLALPRHLNRYNVDLFLATHFNVPFFCPVPYVVTVHDLILHRYPNQASMAKQAVYRTLFSRAVHRARAIIAISEFTAGEIEVFFGRKITDKIHVVHQGVSPAFAPRSMEEQREVRNRYGLPRDFFLYVGNAKQHKNVQLVVDAYQRLKNVDADLALVIGGKEAMKLRLPSVVRLLHHIADEDLPALYSSARAFVTASAYEGFCLPVAEAEACGCPVIAARRGAIPEVASPTATLVEPEVEALAAAMAEYPLLRPTPHPWRWEETARLTSEVLAKALHS